MMVPVNHKSLVTVDNCRHLIDIEIVVICGILSHTHFTGKVLIKCTGFAAAGGRGNTGRELPFPGWDSWRLGYLKIFKHVLSTLLLFISERVQSREGTVLHLGWCFFSGRSRGRASWTRLLTHYRERAGMERIGCCRLTPPCSTRQNSRWRLAPGMWRGTKLRWPRLAPGRGWYGYAAKARWLLIVRHWTWSCHTWHRKHGGWSSGGSPHVHCRDTGGCWSIQLKVP